jgi:hypothetical protein
MGAQAVASLGRSPALLPSLACEPSPATLVRSVTPVWRSRTNTSQLPFVSPGTRLEAKDEKATWRPSALIVRA